MAYGAGLYCQNRLAGEIGMMRLLELLAAGKEPSVHAAAKAVARFQLHVLAYNLGNFIRGWRWPRRRSLHRLPASPG
jgi:hypothetical protein